MAVRLRVSSTNLHHIEEAVGAWASKDIPIILTFMAYYTYCPEIKSSKYRSGASLGITGKIVEETQAETENYVWQERHVNSYWCPKPEFIERVVEMFKGNELVFVCGKWCKDCGNCEKLYLRWKEKNGKDQNQSDQKV